MTMFKRRLIPLIMAGILCVAQGEPSSMASTMQLTEADAGRTIQMRVGDRLEVALPGNPTTGFQWEVGALNHAVLRPIGEPEFERSSSAIGSGGKVTMRFEAVGPGATGLQLVYRRPFEKDAPPARTFEVTATVQ
jgi:inhibitor of cysteine peptidase